MHRAIPVAIVLGSLVVGGAEAKPTAASLGSPLTCESVQTIALPDAKITTATVVAAQGESGRAHCKVTGVIGKEIQFIALLPIEWNGKFFMGGGGGFVGSVESQAAGEVNSGYAVGGTDTGHQGSGIEARWALGHEDRLINYGYLAVHRTTETVKALITAYYGRAPERSYFMGCSNGGRQALMEAQRYPEDFDGIVAGAPAYDFTDIGISFVRNERALFPDPAKLTVPVLAPSVLQMVETKVLAACDAKDGVTDGVLGDPRACDFKLSSIAPCPADQPGVACLTRIQRTALETIYSPTRDAKGEIYPGQPFGGEGQPGSWHVWITGDPRAMQSLSPTMAPSAQWAFGTEIFKYFVFGDSTWTYANYDLARARTDLAKTATLINADDPNLDRFTARGGRLLLWHGWADPALNALATINYFNQATARRASLKDQVRLFLMPGVLHCAGGPGPDQVEWGKAIADWVEQGKTPERLVAAKMGPGRTRTRTRPLCAYPRQAVWGGKGSTDDELQFSCQ